MGILIDTTVFIDYERGRLKLREVLRTTGAGEQVYFSVITMSELLHGVHRAQEARMRQRRATFVEALFRDCIVLGVQPEVARIHARVWANLTAAGTPIGAHDLWLAATCLTYNLRLATSNLREFRRVPDLQVDDWSIYRHI